MVHILLCCGGGFSSSALAAKLKKDIQQYQLEDQFEIEFSPFMIAQEKMDRFDIVVCCPHLTYDVKKMVQNASPDKPIYILPPRMYGLIDIRELSTDVLDVLEMYSQSPINPVHFPGVFCKTFLHNIAKKKYTPLRLKFFSDYFGLDRAFLSRKLSPVKLKMCA
jgi:PTS system cellobiose-specific IIB component